MMEIYFDEINETEVDDFGLYFKEIRVIGSGSYGTVIQAIYLETDEEVAVKIVRKDNKKPNQINKIKQEVNILKQLKHKNIIEFKNYIETNSKLYIIMEYIENGTLKNLIDIRKTEKNNFTDEEVSSIMKSLFEAINYLHSFHIVHRDLKPENILIYNRNDFSSIKLADFGLSAQYFEIKEEFEFCGTLIYMAPEQIVKKFYSKSIDIWSCGIIMYILLNFIHPLYRKGDTKNIYLKKLLSPNWKFIQNVSP
jgi:calcium/calmodulin-dependent protein kinase I